MRVVEYDVENSFKNVDFSENIKAEKSRLELECFKNHLLGSFERGKADELLDNGAIAALHCSYLPESRSGNDLSGMKVKGTIQWVNAADSVDVTLKKYDRLLKDAEYAGQDFNERLNYDSVHAYKAKAEKYIETVKAGESFQLLRIGYYKKNVSDGGKIELGEIVSLKDTFKPKA